MNSPPQRYEPMVAMICLEKNEWEGGRIVLVVVQFAQLLTRFFLDRSWLPWAHDVEVENSSEKLEKKKYLESVFEK